MGHEVKLRFVKDADGKDTDTVCVHLFVNSAAGPIKTKIGRFGSGVTGYIACNPTQQSVTTRVRDGVHYPCLHTMEVEAATCPDCLATPEGKDMLERCRRLAEDPQAVRLAEITQAQAAALHKQLDELSVLQK